MSLFSKAAKVFAVAPLLAVATPQAFPRIIYEPNIAPKETTVSTNVGDIKLSCSQDLSSVRTSYGSEETVYSSQPDGTMTVLYSDMHPGTALIIRPDNSVRGRMLDMRHVSAPKTYPLFYTFPVSREAAGEVVATRNMVVHACAAALAKSAPAP